MVPDAHVVRVPGPDARALARQAKAQAAAEAARLAKTAAANEAKLAAAVAAAGDQRDLVSILMRDEAAAAENVQAEQQYEATQKFAKTSKDAQALTTSVESAEALSEKIGGRRLSAKDAIAVARRHERNRHGQRIMARTCCGA